MELSLSENGLAWIAGFLIIRLPRRHHALTTSSEVLRIGRHASHMYRLSKTLLPYLLLSAMSGVLFFWNLGKPSLWDIDEGNNAEAAREMLVSGDWIVPTFNYQLRSDKPALLYWLQLLAYRMVGVNELAARLPSALAAVLTVLAVYRLGKELTDRACGFLAATILGSTISVAAAAHFANPDALLLLFTVLALHYAWRCIARPRAITFVVAGACMGAATLAKGPVGFLLPSLVVAGFLATDKRWKELFDRRWLLTGSGALAVAAPWFIWVGIATRLEFWRGFFLTHNAGRFWNAMEGHHGAPFYYLICLVVGLGPWSAFLGTILPSPRNRGGELPSWKDQKRYLWCWILVYLVFFSVSSTKLPNYILPLYPPLAILIAHRLEHWRLGVETLSARIVTMMLIALSFTGMVTGVIALWLGGWLQGPAVSPLVVPHFTVGVAGGAVLVAGGALGGWFFLRRNDRLRAITCAAASCVIFTATLGAWGGPAVEAYKAPCALMAAVRRDGQNTDYRIISYRYFEPSCVFYAHREVLVQEVAEETLAYLKFPMPVYLLVREKDWESLKARAGPASIVARHHDVYKNCEILVVRNEV